MEPESWRIARKDPESQTITPTLQYSCTSKSLGSQSPNKNLRISVHRAGKDCVRSQSAKHTHLQPVLQEAVFAGPRLPTHNVIRRQTLRFCTAAIRYCIDFSGIIYNLKGLVSGSGFRYENLITGCSMAANFNTNALLKIQ
jgi:hypothetical protein